MAMAFLLLFILVLAGDACYENHDWNRMHITLLDGLNRQRVFEQAFESNNNESLFNV